MGAGSYREIRLHRTIARRRRDTIADCPIRRLGGAAHALQGGLTDRARDAPAADERCAARFRNGALAHSEYDRKIEEAYVSGDVVVLMGEEVVVMRGSNQANVGEKMRRRFTSAWRKNNGQWQQVARQATNVGSIP